MSNKPTYEELEQQILELKNLESDRKQAEVAIGDAQKRYRILFENALDAIIISDKNGHFIEANSATAHLLGYDSPDDLKGMSAIDLYKNPDIIEQLLNEMKLKGFVDNFELSFRKKDGSIIQVLDSAIASLDDQGEIIRIEGIIKDVTDKKRIQDDLRSAEQKYRDIFENSALGIYRTDPEGRIIDSNPAILKILGFDSLEDLQKRNLEKEGYGKNTNSRNVFKSMLEKQTELTGFESTWVKKNGDMVHVREHAKVVRDDQGKILFYNGTIENITERKQAQEELKESEARYRSLVENSSDLIFLIDDRGIILSVNRAGAGVLRKTQHDILGKNISDLFSKENANDYLHSLKKVFKTGKLANHENTMIAGNRTYWIDTSLSPVRDSSGNIYAIMGVSRDITERKQAEEQLAESDNLKELLLDIITHDLRNPAASIFSFSELAQKSSPENEIINLIHSSSERLIKVLESTTVLTHATFGEKVPKVELNLFDCVADVVDDLRVSIQASKMELELDIPKKLKVLANPLITEIFKNYISNATKYACDGKKIFIEAAEKNESVIISVKDFGKTIPEDDRMRVFERNAQLAKENKRGRGLGLAIVKRIAIAHGGEAWVEPNTPQGNSFCLRIPR